MNNRSKAMSLLTILNDAMETNAEKFDDVWQEIAPEIKELLERPHFEAVARVGRTGVCTFFNTPEPGSYLYFEAPKSNDVSDEKILHMWDDMYEVDDELDPNERILQFVKNYKKALLGNRR